VYISGFGYVTNPYTASNTLKTTSTSPTAQQQSNLQNLSTLSNTKISDGRVTYNPPSNFQYQTTSPASSPWSNITVPKYPTTGASLPGYYLAQINEQKRRYDWDLQNALATAGRGEGRARIEAGLSRDDVTRGFERSSDAMLRKMAGRGTSRFGFTAGRNLRNMTEDLNRDYGRIDFDLSNDIAALRDLVRQAEAARLRGLGDLESQESIIRSDPSRYILGAQQ